MQTKNTFFKKLGSLTEKYIIIVCAIVSLLSNFVIESLSRHSVIDGFLHIFESPRVFLYNSLVIFVVSLLSLFFKKRIFAITLSVFPFIVLGIINCAVLAHRVTPVSATDFVKLSSIFSIFNLYVEGWVLALLVVAVICIIIGFILLYRVTPVHNRNFSRAVVIFPLSVICLSMLFNTYVSRGTLSKKFTNLNDAYEDWGFIYCFSCSVFDTGIDRPANYSKENVTTILDEIRSEETRVPEDKPNIIFLQLESFFDVNEINSLSYSADPIPFFTSLKRNYPHGRLRVPYIGSGTANVEFEILTGMSLDYFGPGEYPYKTVLQSTACESLAFNLSELGYSTHAVHNHKGAFYDRAHVFSSLGFDTFTSFEFMQNIEYNPIGWAKDKVLAEEIIACLDSSEGEDFVYGISVQSHGVYSKTYLEGVDYNYEVTVENPETLVDKVAFEYYLTQMKEVDDFIADLILQLSVRDEKTVVVLYGDHLPYFGLTDEEMANGSVYETEYVIWSNYGLEAEARDLYSYELSAHVLGELGMNNGLITKLHQNSADRDDDYYKYLEMLQYDMLYGKKECYGYEIVYKPTKLQMGIKPLTVEKAENTEEGLVVTGDMYTDFTKVTINSEKYDVVRLDTNVLLVPDVEANFGDVIRTIQTNGKRTTFAKSEPYIYSIGHSEENFQE